MATRPIPPTVVEPVAIGRLDAKLLLTVEDAAELLSIGRTNTFRLIKDGELQSVKIGARRLVPRAAVEAYVVRLLATS